MEREVAVYAWIAMKTLDGKTTTVTQDTKGQRNLAIFVMMKVMGYRIPDFKGDRTMEPNYIPIQDRVRRGKLLNHPQGYSINVFRGDEIILARVFGGSPEEAEHRAEIVVRAFQTEKS